MVLCFCQGASYFVHCFAYLGLYLHFLGILSIRALNNLMTSIKSEQILGNVTYFFKLIKLPIQNVSVNINIQ